jgi:hypothetical protein
VPLECSSHIYTGYTAIKVHRGSKADILPSPSTATRGALSISCGGPSQPHGPAGTSGETDGSSVQRSIAHSQCTQCPPAPPTPNAPAPNGPGKRPLALPAARRPLGLFPPAPLQKIIGRIATSQAHFSTTRAEQSINHSRRPSRLRPSFPHQVVESSSAQPRRAHNNVYRVRPRRRTTDD